MDAARRGWPIQLRSVAPDRLATLIASYRETLASAGHSESIVRDCLRWLVVAVDVPAELVGGELKTLLSEIERSGASEIRLDLAPGVSLDELAAAVEAKPARSV